MLHEITTDSIRGPIFGFYSAKSQVFRPLKLQTCTSKINFFRRFTENTGASIHLSRRKEKFSLFFLLLHDIHLWEILSRLHSHFHATFMHVILVMITL